MNTVPVGNVGVSVCYFSRRTTWDWRTSCYAEFKM